MGDSGSPSAPLILQSAGKQWGESGVGSTRGGPLFFDLTLQGVSCTSRVACTAVGDSGLVLHWNGLHWSIQRPPNYQTTLTGVACAADDMYRGRLQCRTGTTPLAPVSRDQPKRHPNVAPAASARLVRQRQSGMR